MSAEIIELKTDSVRSKVHHEIARLRETSKNNPTRSARDILINYADILEQNAEYLVRMEDLDLQPVIEINIEMAAQIRYWLK